MENSIDDLNGYLFQAAKNLSNPDLSKEELGVEVKKSLALSKVATNILNLQLLKLKAVKMEQYLQSDIAQPTYENILGSGKPVMRVSTELSGTGLVDDILKGGV